MNEFEKEIEKENWRKALRMLLEIIKNNPQLWKKKWINNIYMIKKIGVHKGEKHEVIDICEKAMSYIRKRLIEVRLHDEARAVYIHQMKFRRWLKLKKGDYLGWALNLFLWLSVGYRKSYAGLLRLFGVTIMIILICAFFYSHPQRIEYVQDKDYTLNWSHYIYFSGMAITTVGYGDIHPKPNDKWALIVSVIEAIFGYILLGVFVAILVGIDEPVEAPREDWETSLFSNSQ